MKFCCDKFEEGIKRDKRSSPNIRIVRFLSHNDKNLEQFRLSEKITFSFRVKELGPYRFYITIGYTKFSLSEPSFFIDFCPFCGTSLHNFYREDGLANEVEGETF
jgi:hypothetical protein